jgi:hypothetical protein
MMLTESGFEVLTAADLSQNELRTKVGDFAAKVAEKGPDTVALVFYAGHGLQIDARLPLPVDVDRRKPTLLQAPSQRCSEHLASGAEQDAHPAARRLVPQQPAGSPRSPDRRAGKPNIVDAKTGAPKRLQQVVFDIARQAEDGRGITAPTPRRCSHATWLAAELSIGIPSSACALRSRHKAQARVSSPRGTSVRR